MVLDASAAFVALQRDGRTRHEISGVSLHAPHLIDAEVVHALRRQVLAGDRTPDEAFDQLATWQDVEVERHPSAPILRRVWDLRSNLSAYDAHYVALAERLGCVLVTLDRRIEGAPGIGCEVLVLDG